MKVILDRFLPFFLILFSTIFLGCESNEKINPDDSGLFIRLLGEAEDDFAFDVVSTPDNGYICLGNTDTTSDGITDELFLIKLNAVGEREEGIKIPSFRGNSIKVTIDGGYIIVGDSLTTDSTGITDLNLVLLRTDNLGQVIWSKTFGENDRDETGISVNTTTDGGFLVLGNISQNNQISGWVIRTDANGELVTSFPREINLEDVSVSTSNVIENSQGDFVWSATAPPTIGSETDMLAVITNINGGIISRTFYGGSGIEESGEIQEITGGYIFVGSTESSGNGGKDVFLVRLNDAGTEVWSQTYGSIGNDAGNSVTQTQDGGFIVTGSITNDEQNTDIYVIKTDSQGNEQWTKTFGGGGDDSGIKILETTDGGFLIFGTVNFANNTMIGVIRTNAQGELVN